MSDCSSCRSTGVTRRDFLARSSVVALTAVLAACGDDRDDGATGPTTVNLTVTLSNFPALSTVGGIAVVSSGSTPVAVVRTATATYRAFSLSCPHQGTTVSVSGAGFRCPNHGATFNGSGAWTGGERTSGLREFAVASNPSAGTLTITS